ncbi:hypothetical protein CRENBAI_008941 [Crenichthys baileyi]|uniref:C2H2-type domain-containing protein n=1 Tax=Crenichthys baileyi TaxID=28760 RepID=A0AAV9R9S2_9TELE
MLWVYGRTQTAGPVQSESENIHTVIWPSLPTNAMNLQQIVSGAGLLRYCSDPEGKKSTGPAVVTVPAPRLKVHQIVHSEERPHTCSDCGASFKVLTSLKLPQRIHTGEKHYGCVELPSPCPPR